jgi:hypothetical protein
MRLVLCSVVLVAGCIDEVDPRWTLDHDHVVAARATPPRVRAGDVTALDALVAHVDGPVTVESPMTAEVARTNGADFSRYLVEENGAWRLEAPDAQTLASARPFMGLPDDAPVPVDVVLTFPNHSGTQRAGLDPFKVKKTVWLGEPSTNPDAPTIVVEGNEVGDALAVPTGRDVYLRASTDLRVNWLTSVGTLYQDDERTAYLHVDEPGSGQLVMVVRDPDGGVAWRVVALQAD